MSQLEDAIIRHRVQFNVYSVASVASQVITITTGVSPIPVDATRFILLSSGEIFNASTGGDHFDKKFTQGGNPLEGSVYNTAACAHINNYGDQGIRYDISATALTITGTRSAAGGNWGFWVIGYWR